MGDVRGRVDIVENKEKKILIVDSDALSRSLLRHILHDYLNIYEVGDGAEAFSFLQRNPDTALLLLGDARPGMDGLELLLRVRLSPYLREMPVVILAEDDGHHDPRALQLGATEFVSKPFAPPLLRQRVANLLRIPRTANVAAPKGLEHRIFARSQSLKSGLLAIRFGDGNETQTIYFSPAYAAICGYSPEGYAALAASGSDIFRTVHPDDFPLFRQSVEKLSANHQSASFTLRIQMQDGHLKDVSFFGKYLAYGEGNAALCLIAVPAAEKHRTADGSALPQDVLDPLTGVASRDTFFRLARKMLDEHPGERYVLVTTDIDRFKVINDLFGTSMGDNILIQLAAFLSRLVVGKGVCGRLGGDTFAMCVGDAFFDVEEMLKMQGLLSDALDLNYNLLLHNGIYTITEPQLDISQMCDRANLARSSIKDNYIRRYAYYDESMRQAMLAEQEVLNNMTQALEHGDFLLYLQPIYSLRFNRPVTAEALVRWKHPGKGIISPGRFVPLFERNRFIMNLDHYMWELVCRYLANRKKAGLPNIPISVNVSRVNLSDKNLTQRLLDLLEKYGLTPASLRLEITESAYMENPRQLISASTELRKAGFKILIDDFGSGYSSLKMLKDIPLDILKIDMKFIADLEKSSRAAAILLGVIDIAQRLDMITVAEGVETKFQFDFLRTAGCDNIQGYYYAKPLPEEAFDAFLEAPPHP